MASLERIAWYLVVALYVGQCGSSAVALERVSRINSISTGAQTFWPVNGHYYQFLSSGVDFNTALGNAASMSYMGRQGHLVTITSAEENAFVIALAGYNFWIAASDDVQEGVWRWVAGPEIGQILSPIFWAGGEPNGGRGENFLASQDGWKDYPSHGLNQMGTMIEYECPINPSSSGYCSRK
jgi:hypothetical protein